LLKLFAPGPRGASSYTEGRGAMDKSGLVSAEAGGSVDTASCGAGESAPPISQRAATLALTQSILGCGVLALPYAFRSAGLVAGGGLMAFTYILSIYTMLALVLIGSHLGTSSFKEAATKTLGERWSTLIELWVLMFTIGVCISYVVLTGTFLFEIVDGLGGAGAGWISPQAWSALVVLFVCWPLSCSPNLGVLQWTSMLGLCGITFTVLAVVLRYSDGTYSSSKYDRNDMVAVNMGTFGNCFPILVVAYGAHWQIPGLYRELAPRACSGDPAFLESAEGTKGFWSMARVIVVSLTLSTVVYGTAGVVVYATFGAGTEDNFVKNFSTGDTVVVLVRFLMTLAVCAAFPLVMISARNTVFNLLFQRSGWTMTWRLRLALSTVLSGICLLLGAAAGDDLGTVLDYNGAVFGIPVCYIAPPVMYLKLPRAVQRRRWRLFCFLSAALGAFLALLGVIAVSKQQASGAKAAM